MRGGRAPVAAGKAGGGPRGEAARVPAAPAEAGRVAIRPVWLQRPEPLIERGSRPTFEGRPLRLLSGPERIEAGWWDSALAGRDYFIAEAAEGALVWIYRERLPLSGGACGSEGAGSGWFLHGRFG